MDWTFPLFAAIRCSLQPSRSPAVALGRDVLHIGIPVAGIAAGVWLFTYTAGSPIAHNVGYVGGGHPLPRTPSRRS